ncbi:hypothetical protein CEG14_12875 [Bordetella genomosp. 1]|uniref:Uncharacterized protein n=1 Tax=Bordetella genomosp. 1 TaxID=1395607 RepID=A0A261SFU1_9BORD|nr:hypothetical protein [Bordetella genomosp. 1]MDQ8034892.1 hypothetical protein [Bordetella sp.]OZI35931.1 hypothetical protein CEG14_12875 [Bordetella genomosp. 1]OZI58598.1 hypothetical protein CAL27_18085 [Bordetella genomosp. 1]
MQEDGFFSSAGSFLGGIIRAVVDGLRWLFGGLGRALSDFFNGLASALGMSPNVFNFALLLLGLLFVWAAIKAFLGRSIFSGLFWLLLAMLLLGALIGG